MPVFEIEGADGQIYEVDAPDQNAAVQAFTKFQPPAPSWGDTAMDMAKAGAAGIGRGAVGLLGLPGTLADGFNSGMSWLTNSPELPKNPLSSESLQSGLSYLTGGASDYKGETTPGQYAGTVGEFLPGAAIGGFGAGNMMRFGVAPGLASEGVGQLTEGTSAEPYARVAAALLAPMAPGLAQKVISPFSGAIPPERMKAIEALRAEGVNPTAGQMTGSNAIRYAESELGGAAAANMMDDQARAFTEAATRRAGIQGIASPQNMTANSERLGQGFDSISARNVMKADTTFGDDLGKVLAEYDRVLPSAQREIVNNMADDIINAATSNGGAIPGQVYQSTRSRLSRMAQSAKNNDPEYANALRGLRNTLDDAMSRSVAPQDAAEWARLRSEYGNMKVLEKAATGAGENAAMGIISPAKLAQSAKTGRVGGYAKGSGDFDELARAGQAVMSPLPNSGTASRLAVRGLMSTPAAAGAIVGGSTGDVITGLMGAAAGAAVPALAGRALMSRPGQAYLTNQLMPQMSTIDPRTLNVIQSLMANQGAQ